MARKAALLLSDPSAPEQVPLLAEAIYQAGRERGGAVTLGEIADIANEIAEQWERDAAGPPSKPN